MLLFIVALLGCLSLLLIRRQWPRWRRQMLWGAIFGAPLAALQLAIVGQWQELGTDWTDSALTFVGLVVVGMVASSLLAIAYGAVIDPRLAPSGPQDRRRLWWLGWGPVITVALSFFGVTPVLALLIGLMANAVLFLVICRPQLIWDVVVTTVGFGLWYGLFEVLFGIRNSGSLDALLGGRDPIGITFLSRPLEVLFFSIGVGLLLGPLFAATRARRDSLARVPAPAATPKIVLGLATIISLLLIFGLSTDLSVLPPRVTAITPTVGAASVNTQVEMKIEFDRPVNRDSVELSISPAAEGSWNFDLPTTGQHGFRQATFRFTPTLLPNTKYTGTISGIRSLWAATGRNQTFEFTTRALPDVVDVSPLAGVDRCQPLTIRLSRPYDQAAVFQATFVPAVRAHIEKDQADTLKIVLDECLRAGQQYRLTITRQLVVRDPETQEVVAAEEATVVHQTTVQPAAAPPAPDVRGSVSATSGLQPVRLQTVLKIAMDYQDQPLSCEAAALKMALAGKGVRVSERDIMKYVGYDPTPHKGNVWGDPDQAFVGNIAGRQNTTGYGVHWGPIARAAKIWRPARTFRNGTPELMAQEIAKGNPIVFWGTIGRAYRTPWRTPTGRMIYAWRGEHTRTIIGFYGPATAPTHFVINDPLAGRLTWTKAQLVYNWGAFGGTGVIIE